MEDKLSNAPYSVAHEKILSKQARLRVARQIYGVLCCYYKRKNFKNFTCLDVGCASGIITRYLSRFFKKTVGVDIDSKAINIAQKEFTTKNLSFVKASVLSLPFQAKSYEWLFVMGLIPLFLMTGN